MKRGPSAVAILGVALIVLFFLPWYGPPAFVGAPWYAGVSGWRFATDFHQRSLFLVPACGLVLVALGALRISGTLAVAAGAVVIVTTVGVYIAPMFPSDTGLVVAIVGAGVTVAGSFLERRAVRAVGGALMAAAFCLPWLELSGAELFDPSCPSLDRTVVPIGVVGAGVFALLSAIAPRRAARYLAWTGALIAVATVLAFVVTNSLIAFAAWSTVLAAGAVIVIALASATDA